MAKLSWLSKWDIVIEQEKRNMAIIIKSDPKPAKKEKKVQAPKTVLKPVKETIEEEVKTVLEEQHNNEKEGD